MSASEPITPGVGKRRTGRNAAVVGGVALLMVVVGAAASPLAAASVELGLNKDLGSGVLNSAGLQDLAFTITSDKLDDVQLSFDNLPVQGTREGDALVFRPTNLTEGQHTFTAAAKGRFGRNAEESRSFEVDNTAPIVTIDKQENVPAEGPFVLTGLIEGAQAVRVDDKDVPLDGGKFRVEYAQVPSAAKVWAQDAAGNVTEQSVAINGSAVPGVRAAHITAFGWAESRLREPILAMIREKKLDTVQLDIKDEDGIIGFDWQNPTAKAAGASSTRYDAKAALDEIHNAGARVVGRIVAFRDPKLAKWAVANGKMDMVIQNTSGGAYSAGNYGVASFTNFANPDVIEYNTALGEEGARLGFDEIMYDYIRKPENLGQVYKGIGDRTPSQAIVDFVATASERIHGAGAAVGAAVYGISAFTPASVAQDIPEMAKHLDFLAPMVYPSHWGKGEYGVANPNAQPYDILKRSLMDFNRLVLATNPKCAIIPWIQDFTMGVRYGPDMVAAQIKAARDVGINSFYLWNAGSRYQAAALTAGEASADRPGTVVYSINKPGNQSAGTEDRDKATAYIKAWIESKKNGTPFVDPTTTSAAPSTPTAPAPSSTPSASATAAPA